MLVIGIIGWMGLLDGLLSSLRMRPRTLFILLLTVYVMSGWHVPLGGTAVSVGGFALPLLCFLFLWAKLTQENRSYAFAAALLLGVTLFLLRYMLQLDPILHVTDEVYLIACAAALLPLLLSRYTALILIIEGLGLCFMEVLSQLFLYPKGFVAMLGDFAFRDALILSVCAALLTHAFVYRCVDASAALMRKVLVKRSR